MYLFLEHRIDEQTLRILDLILVSKDAKFFLGAAGMLLVLDFFVFASMIIDNVQRGRKMGGSSPCASCKLLRRRCAKDCIFAPYFPPDYPQRFAIVHKVFGASNVSKMLQELPVHQRADAVSSMVYEANARMRDPVYGCVGAISYLQSQVSQLQMQLAVAQAEILSIQMQQQQQEVVGLVQNQQILQHQVEADDDIDEKSVVFATGNSYNLSNLQQYCLNFAASAGNVIHQDPPKREFLWT